MRHETPWPRRIDTPLDTAGPGDRLLNIVQVASVLGISPTAVSCAIDDGMITATHFGRTVRVRVSEVKRLIGEGL